MHLNLFRCLQRFCCYFVEKNGFGANIVSALLGKQHINLVNPIIVYISLFITGGLTDARKKNFDLHHRITEDQLFPHNSLGAIIFSTMDADPSYSTQNKGSTMLVVINNSQEARWLDE
jgi:hypothetical protein